MYCTGTVNSSIPDTSRLVLDLVPDRGTGHSNMYCNPYSTYPVDLPIQLYSCTGTAVAVGAPPACPARAGQDDGADWEWHQDYQRALMVLMGVRVQIEQQDALC